MLRAQFQGSGGAFATYPRQGDGHHDTGLSMEQIREIGMRLQRGGVGYYQRENFVHLDVGNVRHWPRMSYDQIARLFPDGKTVHLAADGRPQPRYQEALAEISSRGGVAGDVPTQAQGPNLFSWLFGNHQQDQEEEAIAAREAAPGRGPQVASLAPAAPPPAHISAAERRAAAAAPAVAAIEASQAQAPSATPAQIAAPAAAIARAQVARTGAANCSRRARRAPPPSRTPPPRRPRTRTPKKPATRSPPRSRRCRRRVRPISSPMPTLPVPPSRPAELVRLAALTQQGAAGAGTPAPKADAAKTTTPATTDAAKADAVQARHSLAVGPRGEPAGGHHARPEGSRGAAGSRPRLRRKPSHNPKARAGARDRISPARQVEL